MLNVPAKVGGRPPGGVVSIGEGGGLDGGPAMVGVGCFSCGVMDVGPGGVCGSLFGQGVCLSIAWDARVGSDFVEVGSCSMADSMAEGHL